MYFQLIGDLRRALGHAVRHHYLTGQAIRLFPETIRAALYTQTWVDSKRSDYIASINSDNALRRHFDAKVAGPGIFKFLHYFDIYDRHLRQFVGKPVHILEIGVYSGGSLPMWLDYFGSSCQVTGVDIEPDCKAYERDNIRIVIGDQGDRSFWRKALAELPAIDVVVDDGGHTPEQQRVTLEEVLPRLRPGGIYICEDIMGIGNAFAAYVHALADKLNSEVLDRPASKQDRVVYRASPLQASIASVHQYPFVLVIETRKEQVGQFVATKHGTEWQPFLDPGHTR